MNYVYVNFTDKRAKDYFDELGNMSGKQFKREFNSKFEEYCEIIKKSNASYLKKRNKNLSGIFKITPGRIKNSQGVTYGLINRKEEVKNVEQ